MARDPIGGADTGGTSREDNREDSRNSTSDDSPSSDGGGSSTSTSTDGPNDGRGREAPDSVSGGGSSSDSATDSSPNNTSSPTDGPNDGRGHEAPDLGGGGSTSTGDTSESTPSTPTDGQNDGRGHEAPESVTGDTGDTGGNSSNSSTSGGGGGKPESKVPETDGVSDGTGFEKNQTNNTSDVGDGDQINSDGPQDQVADRPSEPPGDEDGSAGPPVGGPPVMRDPDTGEVIDPLNRDYYENAEPTGPKDLESPGAGDELTKDVVKDIDASNPEEAKTQIEEQTDLQAGEDFTVSKQDGSFSISYTDSYEQKVVAQKFDEQIGSAYITADDVRRTEDGGYTLTESASQRVGEAEVARDLGISRTDIEVAESGGVTAQTDEGAKALAKRQVKQQNPNVNNVEVTEVEPGVYRATGTSTDSDVQPSGDLGSLTATVATPEGRDVLESMQKYEDVKTAMDEQAAEASARQQREQANEGMLAQARSEGIDPERLEAQTGRDINDDGQTTSPEEYLGKQFEDQSQYDLQQGEDFEVVESDGNSYKVRLTDSGLSTVEQQVEAENPSAEIEISRTEDGLQAKQVEQFGDTDWTPFVSGDPVEKTVDSATDTVASGIDDVLSDWKSSGGPQAFLYSMNPAAAVVDTTQNTDVYGEGGRAASAEFISTTAQMYNLPGNARGVMEIIETTGYALDGLENTGELAKTSVAVGESAAEWAVDNPSAAAGAAAGIATTFAVGSAAETAVARGASALTGRRVPSLRTAASMSFEEFKAGANSVRRAGSRVRRSVEARTPSVRLEKNADSGFINVDDSARRQVTGETRMAARQFRDLRDQLRRSASERAPGMEDVTDAMRVASTSGRRTLPDRSSLPSTDDLPDRGSLPSTSDLTRRIRREATSARFELAERARKARETQLRQRAKERARREVVNAQFAMSETIDRIERPDLRQMAPSRRDAAAMASQTLDRVKRRARIEAKNAEFRAAGAYRGAKSTARASASTVRSGAVEAARSGRRLLSEASDINQYGIRVEASEDWQRARQAYEEPDFSSDNLVENVEGSGSNLDPVGQLEGIESETDSGTTTGDALDTTDASQTSLQDARGRDSISESQATRSRSRSADARLVDPARLQQERGPMARDTFDDQRSAPSARGGVGSFSVLADARESEFGAAQTGAEVRPASRMAGARDRLEQAERLAAVGADGELVDVGARVDAGAMPRTRIDTGIRVDTMMAQDTRVDQGLRLDQRLRTDGRTDTPKRGPPRQPPNTPGVPEFAQSPNDPREVQPMGGSEIEFVNPVATASTAFFGGFDSFAQGGMGNQMDVQSAFGGGAEGDLDVTGGEL